MLTPPARAVPLLPFKRVPASWAEQTNAPRGHTPAPGNKRRPSTDAVPRKNISLIPRNPCCKKRAELQSLRTENDALFQTRILFEDKFTARRRCVPQEQAVPSPASSRKPPRRTWSGRMQPVLRSKTSHAHAQRSRVRPASARSCAKSLLPAARRRGGIAAPLPADRKNGMPCPCLCLPPSRRLRPPAALLLLRAALRKRRRLPNLSFQRRTNDERHYSRLSRAQRNALLPSFGVFSSQSGAVLRSEACTSGKRCPSCSPCPEKRLSAAAETVFGRIASRPDFRQKAPHSAGKRPLRPASEFPRSFHSHLDLFPMTNHVETVCLMSRKEK